MCEHESQQQQQQWSRSQPARTKCTQLRGWRADRSALEKGDSPPRAFNQSLLNDLRREKEDDSGLD
jgi:hypothetical protein